MILLTLSLFLLGLGVGSFLNVVIDRLPKGGDVVRGRSHCSKCQHPLAWSDLVPLLSFVVLRGRCRYCGEKISWQYPVVELAMGVSAVSMESSLPLTLLTLLTQLTLAAILIAIAAIDIKHGIIPDKLVFSGILVALGYRLFGVIWGIWGLWGNLKNDVSGLGPYLLQTDFFRNYAWLETRQFLLTLFGSLILYSFFLILHSLFKGRALGGGDVKLAFLVGLMTGFPNMVVAVFSAFLTGALASIILMMLKKKKLGETVPFGPFLVVGTFIALFWGEGVINWYLGFF